MIATGMISADLALLAKAHYEAGELLGRLADEALEGGWLIYFARQAVRAGFCVDVIGVGVAGAERSVRALAHAERIDHSARAIGEIVEAHPVPTPEALLAVFRHGLAMSQACLAATEDLDG